SLRACSILAFRWLLLRYFAPRMAFLYFCLHSFRAARCPRLSVKGDADPREAAITRLSTALQTTLFIAPSWVKTMARRRNPNRRARFHFTYKTQGTRSFHRRATSLELLHFGAAFVQSAFAFRAAASASVLAVLAAFIASARSLPF